MDGTRTSEGRTEVLPVMRPIGSSLSGNLAVLLDANTRGGLELEWADDVEEMT